MRTFLFILIVTTLIQMADSLHLANGAANHTFLEDFAQADSNVEIGDADAEKIEIAFTIPNNTDSLSTAEFYAKSIENLKKKYGKLQKLQLRGGYIFNAKDSKSAELLKDELNYLIETLKTIDKVVNENGIRLRRVVLTAILAFENANGLNVTEILKTAFPEEELSESGDNHWTVPFKIQHGRGNLKLSLSTEKQVTEAPNGRTRYLPVASEFFRHRGPGPMIGSASYDKETNTTKIWSAKAGHVTLEGNHMDSEELEEYYPRNFDGE